MTISLIDLHVHIRRKSKCAKAEPGAMGVAAMRAGLDGIVILDHGYHATEDDCQEVTDATRGTVTAFRGSEYAVFNDPESDHFVIVSDEDPDLGRYTTIAKLEAWCQARNALVILAHPFRKQPGLSFDTSLIRVDAVEMASRATRYDDMQRIVTLADEMKWAVLSSSDAHRTRQVGEYATLVEGKPKNEAELIAAIRHGATTPMEMQWAPIRNREEDNAN